VSERETIGSEPLSALRRLSAFVIDRSLLLVAGTLLALAWANLAPATYARASHVLHFAVNDVAMVFFFALAAKEIVEATRAGGPLASPREAAVPLLGAAAGMIVPALLYVAGAVAFGRPELLRGWAVPCATDIAFSYLVARAIFPRRHPAVPFLLLLAVADDALGLVVLAAFYPTRQLSPLMIAAGAVPALLLAWWLRRRGTESYWPYVLGAGSLAWAGLFLGGVHPALALVPVVPFMPLEPDYHEPLDEPVPRRADTLNVFAAEWRAPVQIVLFFFGFANAGVPLASVGAPTWLILGALTIGKPAGILLITAAASAAGLKRPVGMTYGDVAIVGLAAAIGFTVALFFATAAFPAGPILDQAKMGALLSFVAGPLAVAGSRYRTRRPRPA
jgi:NhaA family Na+:H+ antiporter